MAEAFAAIGLASSIVAFVNFAQKVVARLNEFSNDLKDGTNSLIRIQTQLPLIVDGLTRIKDRAESDKLNDGAKAAIEPVVMECHKQTKRLNEILGSVLPASDSSKWQRKRKVILSLTTDRKVKEISDALNQYLQTLTFYHSVGEARSHAAANKMFWLVPFDRNPSFVGRDSLFALIDQSFKVPKGSQPKVALYGLGGIGKSQIALEYCFRKSHQQPTCSVFWVNAATVARFEESFQSMAKEFGLRDHQDAQTDILMSMKSWLETERFESWIMVIDNVDDETAFFREKCHNGKTPSQIIPHCPHGWLLFTSRTRDVAFDLASPATPICVDLLTTEEGVYLLRKRLGPDPPEAQLIELLAELDHIPLAITQAVSFIMKRNKSVYEYLDLYRMGDASKSRLISHEFLEHGRQEQTMESVARTWQMSFEWIREHRPNAAEILCLMCFYQHHGVPERLLRSEDVDIFEFEDSTASLQAFSLLDMNKQGSSHSTHRLIQLATKLWLEQKGPPVFERWALRALELVTSRFPPPDQAPANDYWEDCQALLPHSDIVLQQRFTIATREADLIKSELLIRTARYLAWAEDNAADLQRRFKRSHDIRFRYLGAKHPDTLRSLGFLFWSRVNFYHVHLPDNTSGGTRDIGDLLLGLRREVLGPRHPDTIDVLSDFAVFLSWEGEHEEAESMEREALKLSTEVNGRFHIDTVNCIRNLATVLSQKGSFEEALELITEAINIRTKWLGPESRLVLMSKSTLISCLAGLGRVDEAITMCRDLMTLKEKVFGPDHPSTLHTASDLAIRLFFKRRHEEALDVLGYILSTIQFSRREYGPYITEQRFVELKMDIEQDMAAKRLATVDIGSNHGEG